MRTVPDISITSNSEIDSNLLLIPAAPCQNKAAKKKRGCEKSSLTEKQEGPLVFKPKVLLLW